MHRSVVVAALILAFAAPAAAQQPTLEAPAGQSAPPPSYVYTAPTGAPSYGYTAPSSADSYQYAPRGRGGRQVIGTRHEQQQDRGLWGGGLGLFLAGWVLDIVLTAVGNAISRDRTDAAEQDAQAWSILPFFGPLVQLGIEAPHPAIPLTTGLMQFGGLVMFVLGMTTTHDAEVPIYAFGDAHDTRTARLGMTMSPTTDGAYATLTLHTM